jgi:hypothetical protein
MLTRAQGRSQRAKLMREIAREEKKKKREHLLALRAAILAARASHKRAIQHARERCRMARVEARAKATALRAKALEELKAAIALERTAARTSCERARGSASSAKGHAARARGELKAEQQFRREMRRIEQSARDRHRELAKKQKRGERQHESDDEVRGNIPPELVYLFNQVKRLIKPSPHRTRTEAFLEYAEQHPREVLSALEDKSEDMIRDLERREREAAQAVRRPLSRRELAELVPF